MRFLGSGNKNANWDNRLIRDLAFIKAEKRYPISKRTILPTATFIVLFFIIIRFGWIAMVVMTGADSITKWLVMPILSGAVLGMIYEQYRALKFDVISTDFFLQDNKDIIKRFLTSQHLAFTQHPEAPEVFMIISRNLDMNPKNDYREVMVFIADDKQILVNGHFTGKRSTIAPASHNYRKMAKLLKEWVKLHINTTNTTAVSRNIF